MVDFSIITVLQYNYSIEDNSGLGGVENNQRYGGLGKRIKKFSNWKLDQGENKLKK